MGHINEIYVTNQEGPARFLHAMARTGAKFGMFDIDMQLWTVDGTNGATYTADYGTDGQQQHPILAFATTGTDDCAWTRFALPPDYDKRHAYVVLWWYANDNTTATHNAVWGGTCQRVPSGLSYKTSSSFASNVVLDAAGAALGSITSAFVSDTAYEVQACFFDLQSSTDGLKLEPLDLVLLKVYNHVASEDLGAAPVICHSAVIYSRGSSG
jgi:hypothetical protein